MSDKRPAFQWYPKDYLTDEKVVVMTLEEEGAYRRLIDYCWLHGSLPDDMGQMGAMCKCGSVRMRRLWAAVEPCFRKRAGRWHHPRLDLERKKQDTNRKAKVEAGKLGAEARWEKGKDGTAIDLPLAKNASSSSTASSTANKLLCEERFEEFWATYPKRKGSNPKGAALKKFTTAINNGTKAEDVTSGARRFAAFCDAEGKTGTEFVPMATTWINQRRWEDDLDEVAPDPSNRMHADLSKWTAGG